MTFAALFIQGAGMVSAVTGSTFTTDLAGAKPNAATFTFGVFSASGVAV